MVSFQLGEAVKIIDVATTYLDALVSHAADTARLAPNARRINNGKVTVEGVEALRAIIRREPVAKMDSFRWIVDGDQAIVFYELDADMQRGKTGEFGPPEDRIPATIGERFQIRDDRIEEIEVVYTAHPGAPRPSDRLGTQKGRAHGTKCSRRPRRTSLRS